MTSAGSGVQKVWTETGPPPMSTVARPRMRVISFSPVSGSVIVSWIRCWIMRVLKTMSRAGPSCLPIATRATRLLRASPGMKLTSGRWVAVMTKIFACRPSRSSDQSFNSKGLRVPFGLTTSSGFRPSAIAFSTRARYLASLVWKALSRSTISPASSMMASRGWSCCSVTPKIFSW